MDVSSHLYPVDDSDRSQVVYSPEDSWVAESNVGWAQNTVTRSQTLNSSARLTFTGNQVTVYGTMSQDNPNILHIASFKVDDMPAVNVSIHRGPSRGPLTRSYSLYQSPIMDNRQHTITVTNMMGSNTISLDYFEVSVGTPYPNGSPKSTMSVSFMAANPSGYPDSGSSPGAATSPGPDRSIPVSGAPRTATPKAMSSSYEPMVRVGAFLGGLALGVLLTSVAMFLIARRRKSLQRAQRGANYGIPCIVCQDDKPKKAFVAMDADNEIIEVPLPAYTEK